MNKKVFIFAGVIIILVLIGYLLYSNLEIYWFKEYTGPSREVRANDYYVMERWLKETGHPVRFESAFTSSKLAQLGEKVVVVHSSVSEWYNADYEKIIPWIEQGAYLVFSMDIYFPLLAENFIEFLFDLGITVESGDTEHLSLHEPATKELIPDFGRRKNNILVDNENEIYVIKDNFGYIRLAEVSIGKGALILTGDLLFMYNDYLEDEINAALAWNLTGERAKGNNTGVAFFINRTLPKNMFGKIMERGNLLPVGISAFLLIVLGFWMVIPIFGLVPVEKQKNARPIRERFLAEIRFLKKHRALDYYLNDKMPDENSEKKAYIYHELINQYRRMIDGTENS